MKHLVLLLSILTILSCNNVDTKKMTIGIQPIGNVKSSLIDTLQATIQNVYHFESVIVMDKRVLPPSAFISVKSPRYRADSIIRILKREKPDSIDYIIGITNKDISTTKRNRHGKVLQPESKYLDWGIFGLGFRPGPTCILSTFRIKSDHTAQFMDRMKKVCMHEIGHNLGLSHCEVGEKCVMRDAAETIKTIDHVDLELCPNCKSLIN